MDSVWASLYRGFAVTERQLTDFLREIHDKNVIRLANSSSASYERLFFALGSESLNLVIAVDEAILNDFVSYGLIFDARHLPISRADAFVRFTFDVNGSRAEFISRCNLLRNWLYSNCKQRFRICGPEMETLRDPKVASSAVELVGLYGGGVYIDHSGLVNDPHMDRFDWLTSAFDKLTTAVYPTHDHTALLGQKKLFTMMLGFVNSRTVVYVGSAPGYGWLDALQYLSHKVKVISVDPIDLGSLHPRVEHHNIETHTYDDLMPVLPHETNRLFLEAMESRIRANSATAL